jgi:hypothetical protein
MEEAENTLPDQRLIAHSGVVSREIANEMLLVPVSSRVGDLDAIYTLTGVGPRVWTLLREGSSSRQIVDTICEEYEVPPEVAARDVAGFLDALRAKQLVLPEPGQNG